MCDVVRQALNDIEYRVGNFPLAMWQYLIKEDKFPEVCMWFKRNATMGIIFILL